MWAWPQWRHRFTGIVLVYLLATLVIGFGLAQSRRPFTGALVVAFLILGVCLIGVRLWPLPRLILGMVAIALIGYGTSTLPLLTLCLVSGVSMFLMSFVVPTWLSPAILGAIFMGEETVARAPSGFRIIAVAALVVGGLAFGTLAEQQKRLERDRRELSSTSGELSHTLRQVEYLAFHDALTGLPNRRLLTQRLEETIAQQRGENGSVAVCFIDIDRFKAMNDGAGHTFGDRVLKAVAASIGRALQSGDVLGRQGGDEFILVLSSPSSQREAFERIEQLRYTLAEGLMLDGEKVFATASFGVAFYPDDGDSSDELLRHADLALYRAKDEGRNRVSWFNPELEREASTAFYLDAGLRRALAESEFFLEYQPQVDILTGRTVGIEALMRWQSQNRERIPPDEFLPEAHKMGLMEQIDAWVLESAIRDVGGLSWWRQNPITLAVNISATSLESPEFISRLLHFLTVYEVLPERLELEITESVMSRNTDTVSRRLAELRCHGVGVAIDDFGVGYSSLSYLKDFPATRIKIDRGFVADVIQSDSIARAIVAVAKSLKLDLVAEGVETSEQAERLLQIGCDIAQGFYYQPSVALSNLQLKYRPKVTESPA